VLSNFIEASPASVALATLCSLAAIFYFFNGFMSAMYNYLLPDVVPQQVMGRFISFFRTVGILGGVVFSRYVFVKWETNQHEIFLGVGLIYLATFLLMCWRVKEGEYPPPTKDFEKKGMVHNIKTYFRECFSVSFYRWIFLLITLMTLVYCAPFSMLFFQETLKLSADEMGKFIGWTYLFMGIATPLAGIICDKFHVVRVLPVALLAVAVMHFTCFVAVHDLTTLYIYGFLTVLPGAFVGICQSTICILLLPKPKYGQYMSAMGIIVSIGVIFGNYLAGLFFDIFHNYQLMYIWNGTFEVLACVASAVIFLNWKKLGGATNYVCPETALTAATPDGPPDLR
jgi:predicted MFS family arabinose efflux permease